MNVYSPGSTRERVNIDELAEKRGGLPELRVGCLEQKAGGASGNRGALQIGDSNRTDRGQFHHQRLANQHLQIELVHGAPAIDKYR